MKHGQVCLETTQIDPALTFRALCCHPSKTTHGALPLTDFFASAALTRTSESVCHPLSHGARPGRACFVLASDLCKPQCQSESRPKLLNLRERLRPVLFAGWRAYRRACQQMEGGSTESLRRNRPIKCAPDSIQQYSTSQVVLYQISITHNHIRSCNGRCALLLYLPQVLSCNASALRRLPCGFLYRSSCVFV